MNIDRSDCAAPRHGDASAYSWWRCRCPDARESHRLDCKRRREGRAQSKFVDITGVARRIQALVALGHGWEALGRRLGISRQRVIRLATGVNARAHVDTAAKVRDLFEELSATPAPDGFPAARARRVAARYGYVPPLAWGDDIDDPDATPNVGSDTDDIVDHVAIREVLAGRLPFAGLREQEKLVLFRDHVDDWGYNRIMDLLRMSAGTVTKWRTLARYSPQQVAA